MVGYVEECAEARVVRYAATNAVGETADCVFRQGAVGQQLPEALNPLPRPCSVCTRMMLAGRAQWYPLRSGLGVYAKIQDAASPPSDPFLDLDIQHGR